MPSENVKIRTADGECPATVFTPSGKGPWPAVICYMDVFGIRPALLQVAQRIADFGYVVLLHDQFYRNGAYAEMSPKEIFASGDMMKVIGPFIANVDNKRAGEDSKALIAYLDTRSDVAGKKIGVHGYCMGGAWALSVAGANPDRVAAAASFHGGFLAVEENPQSPHHQFKNIKGHVYIAAADKDNSYSADMAALTVKALMAASVAHKHELYKDVAHGWTMPDFPVYNQPGSERHFEELKAFYGAHLR